jgi:hypothetical protein
MIFHPKDTNRRHFMCVKFKLNRYRFAVVIAISFGGHFFPDTVYITSSYKHSACIALIRFKLQTQLMR